MEVVRRERYSDDNYNYEKIIFDTGTTVTNRHPKIPERDPAVIRRELGGLLYNAWRNLGRS